MPFHSNRSIWLAPCSSYLMPLLCCETQALLAQCLSLASKASPPLPLASPHWHHFVLFTSAVQLS